MKQLFLVELECDDSVTAGDIEDNIFDHVSGISEIAVHTVNGADILDELPKLIQQYLVFDIEGEESLSIDFGAIASLMDYIAQKPTTVCQTLLKVLASLTNLHHRYYDLYNRTKDDFDAYVADRTTFYADEENGLNFKRTKDNIEQFVKSEETWKRKHHDLKVLESNKSKLYSARELTNKAYDTCREFIRNSGDVHIGRNHNDRSFREVVSSVATSVAEIDTFKVDE